MRPLSDSVLDVIGATPLVALDRLTQGRDGRIFAKLEFYNPGLSKKDRIALRIIEDAESAGDLKPGQPVVELTSGNTGTGAAIVCAVKGRPFVAVMSVGNSEERARMMRAYGAEVVLVEQAPGSRPGQVSGDDLALVETRAQEIVHDRGAFRLDQFHRPGNASAHEDGTGAEIWTQSGGTVTAFCDFVGSGGTFAGVSRALKSRNPDIRAYVVEPESAPVLSGRNVRSPQHRIQGGGYSMDENALPLLEGVAIDGYLTVTDEEARDTARLLASREGVLGGYSAGANVAGALKLLVGPERGGHVAVLICDSGLKYLSTDLWS